MNDTRNAMNHGSYDDSESHSSSLSKGNSLRGLLTLNGVLLLALGAVTFGAVAQGQSRGRGEYTMVAGGAQGSDSPIVYVVDVINQEMIAMTYNANTKMSEGVGYRNLAADAATISRGRTRPTP